MRNWQVTAIYALVLVGSAFSGGGTRAANQVPGLVVLNKSDNTAMIFRLDTKQRLATLPTGVGPHEVAVSPDQRYAYITNYGAREPGHTLTVVDLATLKVVRTLDLAPYTRPHGITVLANGHVLVTCEGKKALVEVDPRSGKVVRTMATDQEVSHMVVTGPDQKRAYVANIRSGTVSVLDLENGTVVKHIPSGQGTEGLAITRDGKRLLATNRAENTVSFIDPERLAVVHKLETCAMPIRVKWTGNEKTAVVSCARANAVDLLDMENRKSLGRIPVGSVPIGIVIDPRGRHAYVALTEAARIAVVDLEQARVVDTITTGNTPDGMAWVWLGLEAASAR